METHEKIKQLRILRGLSQDSLAQLTGYTDRSSIAKVEAGKVDLSQSKISLFAKALGVSPAELMQIADTPAPLSSDEQDLIDNYRKLTPIGKEYIRQTMAMARQSYSFPSVQLAARGEYVGISEPVDPNEVETALRETPSET